MGSLQLKWNHILYSSGRKYQTRWTIITLCILVLWTLQEPCVFLWDIMKIEFAREARRLLETSCLSVYTHQTLNFLVPWISLYNVNCLRKPESVGFIKWNYNMLRPNETPAEPQYIRLRSLLPHFQVSSQTTHILGARKQKLLRTLLCLKMSRVFRVMLSKYNREEKNSRMQGLSTFCESTRESDPSEWGKEKINFIDGIFFLIVRKLRKAIRTRNIWDEKFARYLQWFWEDKHFAKLE